MTINLYYLIKRIVYYLIKACKLIINNKILQMNLIRNQKKNIRQQNISINQIFILLFNKLLVNKRIVLMKKKNFICKAVMMMY